MAEPGIVRATPAHAAILSAIHAAAVADGWPETEMAALLAMPAMAGLIHLGPGDEPDGFLLAQAADDEAEIVMLAVHPGARRKGIATCLLDRLLQDAAEAGIARLFLEVAEDNRPARALYEKAGFAVTGKRPDYYRGSDGSTGDALIMTRRLG